MPHCGRELSGISEQVKQYKAAEFPLFSELDLAGSLLLGVRQR